MQSFEAISLDVIPSASICEISICLMVISLKDLFNMAMQSVSFPGFAVAPAQVLGKEYILSSLVQLQFPLHTPNNS